MRTQLDISTLEEGDALSFRFRRSSAGEEEGYLLRYQGRYVAFVNRCPHWDVDLDLGLGVPFDAERGRVFCRNHGALFEPFSGRCVAGPCAGQSLEMLPVVVEGTTATVHTPLPIVLL